MTAPYRNIVPARFMKPVVIALVLTSFACEGCSSKSDGEDSAGDGNDPRVEAVSNAAEVTVMKLEPKMFTHEVVSNGKVKAGEYVDLRFSQASAPIKEIRVKNGERVRKGDILAQLDLFKLENAVTTARNNLERVKLELADALIGQGYDPGKAEGMPDDVMGLARLRSGVSQAEIQLAESERELSEAVLRAPFDGVVANMFQKSGNLPDGSQPFCRVISAAGMDVDFPVLESELPLINRGDAVEVLPYTSDEVFQGRISAVNPIVGDDGLVKVSATVNGASQLFDGMNVKVKVRRNIQKALVVPKSAVVLRSGGRQVVFTHENGRAKWNYVTTSLENMEEYVVTDGLAGGEEVIVTGNINIAHDAPVTVISE